MQHLSGSLAWFLTPPDGFLLGTDWVCFVALGLSHDITNRTVVTLCVDGFPVFAKTANSTRLESLCYNML